jgi:hypothetical protein
MEENKRVAGSVIQRSIVLEDISAILSVASIPSEDIGYQKSLKFAITQLFGVSSTDCLTNFEYDRSLKIISEPKFWHRLEEFYYEFYGPPFDIFLHEWYRYFMRWTERYFKDLEKEKASLSDDVIVCQLVGLNIANVPVPLMSYPLPFPYLPLKKNITEKFLKEFEIKPEYFTTSLKIRMCSLLASERVKIALSEIYEYHIPFGESPKSASETFRNIIKHAKSIVVAPLIAGALGSATLISTGQYILAIECALASGGSTIVLVATTSLADRILDYISKKRGKE